MPTTSCISHPAQSRIVRLRESYLELTENHVASALLLDVFEYETNTIVAHNKSARRANRLRVKEGMEPLPVNKKRWFYSTIADFVKEINSVYKRRSVITALGKLEEAGFIESTQEPGDTKKWRMCVKTVQQALTELPGFTEEEPTSAPDPIGDDAIENGGVEEEEELLPVKSKPFVSKSLTHEEMKLIGDDELFAEAIRRRYDSTKGQAVYIHRPDTWQWKYARRWWDKMEELKMLTSTHYDARTDDEEARLVNIYKWADDFDKLVRLRDFDKEDVDLLLHWLFNVDDFWIWEAGMTSVAAFQNKKDEDFRCHYMLKKAQRWKAKQEGQTIGPVQLPQEGEEVKQEQLDRLIEQYGNIRHHFAKVGFDKYQNPVYRYRPKVEENE